MDRELRQRHQILAQLQQNISKTQERMMVTHDKGRRERHFEVGGWVYLKLQSNGQLFFVRETKAQAVSQVLRTIQDCCTHSTSGLKVTLA